MSDENHNDFSEALTVLNTARGATFALKWIDNFSPSANLKDSIAITVHWGSATPEGKAVTPYIKKAFQEYALQMISRARELAEADIKAGMEKLR